MKYAAPVEYIQKSRIELEQAAFEVMNSAPIQPSPLVDLVEADGAGENESIEIEIITTLLYGASHYPYRQIRDQVCALDAPRREELLLLGTRHRGRHDELSRAFSSGYQLRFDILMDIGGFRDMHRHRRCAQTIQSFTNLHGYDVPELIADSNLRQPYEDAVRQAHAAFDALSRRHSRGERNRSISSAIGNTLPLAVQDGFCRGALHFRTAQRTAGPHLLSPRCLGDV